VVNAGATLGGNAVWDMETDCNFLLDGGRLAPGTNGVGVFTVSDVAAGSVWFDGATTNPSVLAIDLAATNSYDRLRLNGALKLNGRDGSGASRLDVTLLNGFAPASDDRFFIVDNYGTQSVAGAFANAVAAGRVRVASNLTCRISYDGDLASQALTGGNDIVIYDLQVRDPSRTGATLTLR
jgi:hypothetical protein